jgi:hypothetical protein
VLIDVTQLPKLPLLQSSPGPPSTIEGRDDDADVSNATGGE